jgi:hypothetical protein
MTADALAAHDAALATADEQRRAAEDAELRRRVRWHEHVAVRFGMAKVGSRTEQARGKMLTAARAELLAYIETIRK